MLADICIDSSRGSKSGPDHVRFGRDKAVLRAIRNEDVTLAAWTRPVPGHIAGALAEIDLSAFGALRFTVPPEIVTHELGRMLAACELPIEAYWPLALDAGGLAQYYASIMALALVELRLEHVPGDGCRKFHADFVTARLLTTYAGRGTQWLEREAGRRHLAGEPFYPADIRQLEEGNVALLKGREWSKDQALVHRSPPMGDCSRGRLLLVINPGRAIS